MRGTSRGSLLPRVSQLAPAGHARHRGAGTETPSLLGHRDSEEGHALNSPNRNFLRVTNGLFSAAFIP